MNTVEGEMAQAEVQSTTPVGARWKEQERQREYVSLKKRAFRRFMKNRLAVVGACIVIVAMFIAAFAPLLAPYDAGEIDLLRINQWPSRSHPFGTDASGVDILSQSMFALRTSFAVAAIASVITLTFGLGIGVSSGYFGGKVDLILSRLIDVLFAFPALLVAMLFGASFGQPMYEKFGPVGRLYLTVAAISFIFWVGVARVIRSQVLTIREAQYIESARVNGARNWWIMRRHISPNILGTAAVMISMSFADTIALEAVLSFIGLGVTPPTASLGRMIQGGQLYIDPYWYQLAIPGAILAILVLSFAFIGDGLRDALDPRMIDT
jgi:ABC-type dipeptide/oligopeptide/nickel transport system permease subunit